MITQTKRYEICRELKTWPILFFEDYLISRDGKLYHLDPVTGTPTDISHIIFDYTKRGVPIYRIVDLKNKEKYLELPLDKLVLNTFVGDLEGKIIHKDFDYTNCSVNNLIYNLTITKVDNSDSLWINNKEFKKMPKYEEYYMSNNGIIYSGHSNILLRPIMNKFLYFNAHINYKTSLAHRLLYSTWMGEIPEELTINHKDGNKRNNHISNLEAISNSENIRHAQNNGLRPNNRWNEKDIHDICKMMEDNKEFSEIAQSFNISSEKEKCGFSTLMSDLRRGKIWKDITILYNINNYTFGV